MVLNMQKILQEMGWNDGYHIPVANTENQKLEAEVERLTIAKAKAAFTFDGLSAKCTALDKHMNYVTAERERNQNILTACKSQYETEKTLYMLAKKDKDRLCHEMKNLDKDIDKIEQRKQSKLTTLNNLVSKIDKLKMSIEWDEQTIEEWEKVLKKKKEDNDIIKRFSEEDKKKLKDLELKRQRLQEDEYSRRQLIIRTSNELDSMELILARNVQLYKQRHDERSALIRQWQEAIKHSEQREKEIMAINREIFTTKELHEAKLEVLDQEKQFYNNEVNNNKEIQSRYDEGSKELAKRRTQLRDLTDKIQTYSSELDILRKQVQRESELVKEERKNVRNLQTEYDQKLKTVQEVIEKITELKEKEKSIVGSKTTSNERIKALEDILKSEENMEKGLLADIEHLQGTVFRSQKLLTDMTEKNRDKLREKQMLEEDLSSILRQKEQIQHDLVEKKEELYKLKYEFAMIQSKLSRMTNEGDEEDPDDNEEKMEELEKVRKDETELNNLLKGQVKILEDVLHNLTNSIAADNEKLVQMKVKLKSQLLELEGAEREIEEVNKRTQCSQVEENLLQVQIMHAEKTLHEEGTQLFTLQRQHVELETLMKERVSEIQINKDVLIAKKNSLNEEKHRLKLDMQERQMKIDHIKKRYDCTLATIGQTEDGAMISVAYFQVKNAQEKYMLQEEGDKLDGQIQKAEKEIIAMENTLKALNMTNKTFQKSLAVMDEQDDQLTEMKKVEDELYIQARALRQGRNKLIHQEKKLEELRESFEKVNTKLEELKDQVAEKENEYKQMDNERKNFKKRIERAEKQLKKLVTGKDVDKNCETDIYMKQLKKCNKTVLQDLSEICVRHMETEPVIKRYLSENKLSLAVPSSKSSSRSSNISQSSSRSGNSIASVNLTLDLPK
ncbi:uncharacterized protein CBL_06133 [Carabus blaptoides fortunei]